VTNDVRRNQLARVETTDGRDVRGVVEDVREDAPGHERVIVRDFDTSEELDTAADRVEVVEC